jgi:carboxymethylenebutenolidase
MDAVESGLEGLLPRSQWTRRGFVVTSLASGFALSVQPVSAETIHTDSAGLEAGEVKVPVKDGSIPAYRAMPDKGGPSPTVLVVQEIFGVHEHIQDLCRRLAKTGYYAIAPDLYARQGDPSKISDIQELIKTIVSKVPDAQVMSDLDATVAYAKSPGKADTAKLAVTGFCWGGGIVWRYAAHSPTLKAAVAWYGPVDRPRTELQPKYPIDLAGDPQANDRPC